MHTFLPGHVFLSTIVAWDNTRSLISVLNVVFFTEKKKREGERWKNTDQRSIIEVSLTQPIVWSHSNDVKIQNEQGVTEEHSFELTISEFIVCALSVR